MTTTKKAPAPAAAAKVAPAPAAAATTAAATRYAMGPWPAKHASGQSIRCYMHKVALALHTANPNGFTVAMYASALAGGLAAWQASGGKVPNGGFGTAAAPNGAARAHALWPCNPAQGYLVAVAK